MRRLWGSLVILAHLHGQRRAPFLPRPQIEARRDAAIRHIVSYAARTVPYYRELFACERVDPREIRGAAELDALPLLDPELVRENPQQFLSESRRARRPLTLRTGSVGHRPLELQHDRRSLLANIAHGERERAPVIELCGGSFRPRELHVGYEGSNFKKVLAFYAANARRPPPRREQVLMIAPFDEIVAAINRVRPDVLTAYGGFLETFCQTVVARGVRIHTPKVVMYMGEPLSTERRDWIERELGARVMSRYVATEAFKIGYFCEERTGFHLHDDLCHVRILRRDGSAAAPDEMGEIVISNLVNHATVLLNYPMGDVAALTPRRCRCGRRHRLLSEVQGRVEDVLLLPNGEHLHPREIWSVFKDDPDVLQYQLVQQGLRRFDLNLTTEDRQAFPTARDRALPRLRQLLGEEAEIESNYRVDLGRSERERSGKFHAVESRLPTAPPRDPRRPAEAVDP